MSNLRSEAEILSSWKGDLDSIKVSIRCAAYNHERFIEDAIIGFLSQITDFPIEICIHDDASTDKTAEIIRRYEKEYPNIFRAIYQTENQYSKDNKPTAILEKMCSGEYIAVCEGDDFWRDPTKLAKQVSYLDRHPEIVISSHDAWIVDEKGNLMAKSKLPPKHHRCYSSDELIRCDGWLLALNMVYRNINFGFISERHKVMNGDTFLTSLIGNYGGSYFHTDIVPSAYRAHPGGVWSSLNQEEKLENSIQTYFWIYRYYKRIGQVNYADIFFEKYKKCTLNLISKKEYLKFRYDSFYSEFSSITKWAQALADGRSKYLIYGNGTLGKYIHSLLKDNVIGFVDRDCIKNSDVPVYSILEISQLDFDSVIISLIGREDDVLDNFKNFEMYKTKKIRFEIYG
ncbi:glycosyltransferase family 2 protein [Aliidiomarina quisquiliarum]|uniref:glycosyltransferase family 2 protein n=1 Tax=Aliidiomarina quisquiliarum TaxID=2938947 RepID=UPI00208F04E9|nr:glycosyltransferase family 2 protein [Aliidiomarina quisquiliarum]MCO4319942.1 glycosyltransferase family 2 protein [Aliidiomarina quisquiliarum]